MSNILILNTSDKQISLLQFLPQRQTDIVSSIYVTFTIKLFYEVE